MDNVIEVVALLRKHSELELQILNGRCGERRMRCRSRTWGIGLLELTG
jgi:hypothetical protein